MYQQRAGAGSVIFTPTNPKVTQTVSGAAVARELRVFTHQGFFNIDKVEHAQQQSHLNCFVKYQEIHRYI